MRFHRFHVVVEKPAAVKLFRRVGREGINMLERFNWNGNFTLATGKCDDSLITVKHSQMLIYLMFVGVICFMEILLTKVGIEFVLHKKIP